MNHDRFQPEKRLSAELHQILRAWVRTLPIDGQSGDSVVTLRDLASLSMQLEQALCDRRSRLTSPAADAGGRPSV